MSFFPSGLKWKWLWTSSEEAEDHAPDPLTPAQAKEAKEAKTAKKEQSSHQTQPPTKDIETSRKDWVMSFYTHNTNKVKQTNKEQVNVRSTTCGWRIVFGHVG